MSEISIRKILQIKNRNFFILFFIISILIILCVDIYIFLVDEINTPENQITIIDNDISNSMKTGYTEKTSGYLRGLTRSKVGYVSAWISKDNLIILDENYRKYNPILSFKSKKFYFSFYGWKFFIINYNYLGDESEYKLSLAKEINLANYILILLYFVFLFTIVIFISYFINSKSTEFISESFKNFIKHCEERNINYLFVDDYKHICKETNDLDSILNNLCLKNIDLIKENTQLEVKAKFSNESLFLAHDVSKISNLLLLLVEEIKQEENIVKCKVIINEFIDTIKNRTDEINTLLQNISFCNRVDFINKNKLDFYSDIYLSTVDKFKKNTNCKFFYTANDSICILADVLELSRAIDNIVINAFEAVQSKGMFEIHFNAKKFESYIEIRIKNTNSYIPEEYIKSIFDLHFTRGKKNGSGLGLASVKSVVKGIGGEITCESIKDDKYVEFILRIPDK